MALLIGGGLVLGVGLALILREIRGPANQTHLAPCTAPWLKLAPTIGIDKGGRVARVGMTAPGPADCLALGLKRTISIRVASADGRTLVRRRVRGGPRPGSEVVAAFSTSISVPALRLCKALQPLHFTVGALGLTAEGDLSLHYEKGRCSLG
jgi:hypothetical protein